MGPGARNRSPEFAEALQGLERGDFSRLEPLFDSDHTSGKESRILQWYEDGLFGDAPDALAEAFTCACFLGRTGAAEFLLQKGIGPSGGGKTGLNAFHW